MYQLDEYIETLLELTESRFQFQLRDFLILLNISKVPMTNIQIANLFWPNASQQVNCANRRLRLLETHKYIEAVENNNKTFFKRGKRGEKLLTLYYGIHHQPKFNKQNSVAVFSKHSMEITNFWINLKVGCDNYNFDCLLKWLNDNYPQVLNDKLKNYDQSLIYLKKNHSKILAKYFNQNDLVKIDRFYAEYNFKDKITDMRHCPDAVFVLKTGNIKLLYFLEIDMGTETIEALDNRLDKQFMKMIKHYPELFSSGRWRESYGSFLFFRVLIVTSTDRRARNIRQIILRRFNNKPQQALFSNLVSVDRFSIENFLDFVWIHSMDKLNPDNILDYSWRSLAGEGKRYCLLEDIEIK